MEEKTINSQAEIIEMEKDWLLQFLVEIVNKNDGSSIGVTIVTHGFLVSGDLVGGKEYFNGFGQQFESMSKDSSDSVQEYFKKMGEETYSDENKKDKKGPSFIHLKNAKFFNAVGNSIPTDNGTWWRGKISNISGFSLGKLAVQ